MCKNTRQMNGRSPDARNAEGVSIHCIVANRHDGQSFFAITPSAERPSEHNPTRNFGIRHIGQALRYSAFGGSVFWT